MGSFDGLAEIYEKSRHGYPAELRNHLTEIGALTAESVVVDLGAGTGQLAMMAADVALTVLAIDPEPDMVHVGQQFTRDRPAIQWMSGADRDIRALLHPPIHLVLIGNAFHHMNQPVLLADLDAIVDSSGVVVVCSTSVPVWLQETDWSVALRQQLSEELGRPITSGGTPDHASDVVTLGNSTFSDVERWTFEREYQRSGESIVGEVVSSASGALGDASIRRLLSAIGPHLSDGAVTENVRTTALIARRPAV